MLYFLHVYFLNLYIEELNFLHEGQEMSSDCDSILSVVSSSQHPLVGQLISSIFVELTP